MSIRATTTHVDKYGVTHRIDLLKDGYVGASTELRGTSSFIGFNHDNLNEDVVFRTPVMSGRLDASLWVDSSAGRTVINEVMASQPGDFTMEWYQGGTLFWRGIVEPDFTTLQEAPFPYVAQITARDLPSIGGYTYPSVLERKRIIEVMASALNVSGLNLPIRTRTSWICAGTNTAVDFMDQVYVNELALRDFADNTNLTTTARPWTMRKVVEELSRSFKLFVRQTDGAWYIEQMSAHVAPTSVLETVYTSAGAFVSSSNINPVLSANTVVKVVAGSNRMSSPAVQSVRTTYDHRSRNFGILFQPVYTLTGASETFAQNFVVDGTQTINMTGTVQVRLDNPLPDSAFVEDPHVNIMIRVGALYWDGRVWSPTEAFTRVRLFGESSGFIVREGGEEVRQLFAGSINITTDTVPTDLTAGDTLTVTIFTAVTPTGNTTRYNGLALFISNADDAKQSRAIVYELSRGGTGTLLYDDGVSFFGSGPTTYSPGALTSNSGSPDPLSNALIINWQRRGTTPDRILSDNLMKEVVDQMRGYRFTLEAVIKSGGYTPAKTLAYDGEQYMYIGGRYDGYSGEWTAVFKQNAVATGADVLVTLLDAPGANFASGLLQATQSARNEAIEGAGIDGMRLALEATGTISQITVFDRAGVIKVRKGQKLRIVNPVTLDGEEVTATADRKGSVINVTPVTLEFTYPRGSYVFITQESVAAGIVVGENAVRIFAEGQALGRLTADVNGVVTTLPVNLYTRVLPGMDMKVINASTGDVYAVTVENGPWGAGEVTIDIEEQLVYARAGDPLIGDNSFQQSQITVTQGLIVLRVDSNGDIAQVKLGAQGDGSAITIQADQITVAGQTTFLNALNTEGFPTVSSINRTIQATTAPTTRTSGAPLVFGDLWVKTDDGNKPYVWTQGSPNAWVQAYTEIDGGFINTGTLDANRIIAGTITANEIALSTITGDKLASTTITGNKIATGTITATQIATDTITATQIASGTITATEIASATITGDKLVAGTITATQLGAGSVTANKINVDGTISLSAGGIIKSTAFTAGSDGWQIESDGTAEFNDVTVRGTLSTTTVRETITVGASAITGDIRSFGYTAGTSGWQIESDGSAEFNDVTVRGEIEAQSGAIEGTLTMGTLGKISGGSGDTVWEISVDEILFQEEISGSDIGTVSIAQRSVICNNTISSVNSSTTIRGGFFQVTHNSVILIQIDGYASTPQINMPNLPTSDTGLAVGDLWRDGNTVKVKT
jgi:hypothetical protein